MEAVTSPKAPLWPSAFATTGSSSVAVVAGKEDCYRGARGFVLHPDGKTLFTLSRTVACFHRDPATGKLR